MSLDHDYHFVALRRKSDSSCPVDHYSELVTDLMRILKHGPHDEDS